MENWKALLERFAQANVLVVGDVYLDENIDGKVTGISLEAPIPVYEIHRRRHNPGAAGNAACNVAALGATTYMVGYVGDDTNGEIVTRAFEEMGVDPSGLIVAPDRPTNTYGKLHAGGHNIPDQEILRTDTPAPTLVSGELEDRIIEQIEARASEVDAIVVVDQVASVVTEKVLDTVRMCAERHGLLTVGDSRSRIHLFSGFDVVVPNDREAGLGVGMSIENDADLAQVGSKLLETIRNVAITRGPAGISLFKEGGSVFHGPATVSPREVVDVTGAGDTVTAAIAVTLVAGGSYEEAVSIANVAAGIAVAQPGVVTVPRDRLAAALAGEGGPTKLKQRDELKSLVEELQQNGKTVVWTNGCFDILHVGHIVYLQRAAAEGDALIVGLNSDASVRALKGPTRPVIPEQDRALVLSALECVSYVVIFDEPTTTPLLDALKPDVYAKGGDYTVDTICQEERRLVEGYGGRIAIIPGVEGRSTTNVIKRIQG